VFSPSCADAWQESGVKRRCALARQLQGKLMDVENMWLQVIDGEPIDFPADWEWSAHPRYTADYKRLLLNELRSDSCTRGEMCINRANSNFEDFFMALAFEDVNAVIEAAVQQNARAAAKLAAAPIKVSTAATVLEVALSAPALRDERAQLLNERGGAFVSWDDDLELEDELYNALLRICSATLHECGFTNDKLGLHALWAVIKSQRQPIPNTKANRTGEATAEATNWPTGLHQAVNAAVGSYHMEEQITRFFQTSEGRFEFVEGLTGYLAVTPVTAETSEGSGSVSSSEGSGELTSSDASSGPASGGNDSISREESRADIDSVATKAPRVLIVVFSSIGGGVIRPEFKGTLRAAAKLRAAGKRVLSASISPGAYSIHFC
jgi:hypothetical protein